MGKFFPTGSGGRRLEHQNADTVADTVIAGVPPIPKGPAAETLSRQPGSAVAVRLAHRLAHVQAEGARALASGRRQRGEVPWLALDERDRQEIRELVAGEIQDVLRREMARWWAESILALAGFPPRDAGDPPRDGDAAGKRSAQESGKGTAPTRFVRPRKMAGPDGAGAETPTDYLTQVVESLLRSQELLARELQDSLRRIERLVERGS